MRLASSLNVHPSIDYRCASPASPRCGRRAWTIGRLRRCAGAWRNPDWQSSRPREPRRTRCQLAMRSRTTVRRLRMAIGPRRPGRRLPCPLTSATSAAPVAMRCASSFDETHARSRWSAKPNPLASMSAAMSRSADGPSSYSAMKFPVFLPQIEKYPATTCCPSPTVMLAVSRSSMT